MSEFERLKGQKDAILRSDCGEDRFALAVRVLARLREAKLIRIEGYTERDVQDNLHAAQILTMQVINTAPRNEGVPPYEKHTPGEDAWLDEIEHAIVGGSLMVNRDKLRTILRAYRANLLSQPVTAQEALCGTAASADTSMNTATLPTAKDVCASEAAPSQPNLVRTYKNRKELDAILNPKTPETPVEVMPDGTLRYLTPKEVRAWKKRLRRPA